MTQIYVTSLPVDLDKLKMFAEKDAPEGKHWVRISATLLLKLWLNQKAGQEADPPAPRKE